MGEIHFLLTRLLTLCKREEQRAETPAGFEEWNPGSLGDWKEEETKQNRKEEALCRKAIWSTQLLILCSNGFARKAEEMTEIDQQKLNIFLISHYISSIDTQDM